MTMREPIAVVRGPKTGIFALTTMPGMPASDETAAA